MKTRIAILVAIFVLFAAFQTHGAGQGLVHLDTTALNFACELINRGRFVADQKGAWSKHHSTRSEENAFIQANSFAEYAKWHLVVDERHAPNSKARYKFPFGDFQNVHRCGLLAIKARALEYGYPEVEAAAAKLLEMIESAGPTAEKRVD